MTRRRAYGDTTVPVSRSQEHVRKLLIDAGADRISFGELLTPAHSVGCEFTHRGLLIRLTAPVDDGDTPQRVWRVIHWAIKSRMEAVDAGLEEFAQAFMAHVVDPSTGVTLWDSLRPELEAGGRLARELTA